jgi:hypothetical protein
VETVPASSPDPSVCLLHGYKYRAQGSACPTSLLRLPFPPESPSLVLVINDTKLLMPCVKRFELGISNTCDEGVCGKEWWPQDHKEMVHGHEMMIMVEMHTK